MPSITDIFSVITDAITSFVQSLVTASTGIVSLFWTAPSGTNTTGSFTFLGICLLIVVGASLVWGAYRLIKGMLKHVGQN